MMLRLRYPAWKLRALCWVLRRLRYGDDLYLTFIDPTPEDKEFRTKEMQAAVSNMPIMTQNEARKSYLGLGPIEGGTSSWPQTQ
jgi:hypothetical protein